MMKLVITRRRLAPGGVFIIFQHKECGGEVPVFVSNKSDLKHGWEVQRSLCLQKTMIFFGDAKLGRLLVEVLKKPLPEDRFDAATDPLNN